MEGSRRPVKPHQLMEHRVTLDRSHSLHFSQPWDGLIDKRYVLGSEGWSLRKPSPSLWVAYRLIFCPLRSQQRSGQEDHSGLERV